MSPEEHCLHARDVLVLPGEFTQVLTSREYRCAVHRVLKPTTGSRLSAPLLIRGRPGETITFPLRGSSQEGMTTAKLHRLLLDTMKQDTLRRDSKGS